MTWPEVCDDKRLADLPFKVELNRFGKIEMSPTRNIHGYFASEIAQRLKQLMGSGKTLVECAVNTAEGVKVADAAWASDRTFVVIRNEASCSTAPEICVEVTSPSNQRAEIDFKRQLYLRAGAREFWVCDEEGNVEFFGADGVLERSALCPSFPRKLD